MSRIKTRRGASLPRLQPSPPYGFGAALLRLDAFLADALPRVESEFHAAGALDALRGLHVTAAQARAALRPRGISSAMGGLMDDIGSCLRADDAFGPLIERHSLTTFDSVTLLLALAPEFDLRYQRVFGYLQDDVTKKRPTVDFILSLTCGSDAERLVRRSAFAADGTLRREALIELIGDPNCVHPPLIAQYVKPDEQVARMLLGDAGLDSRLESACRLSTPAHTLGDLHLPNEIVRELTRIAAQGVPIWLEGPEGIGKADIAAALAHEVGTPLLTLDASRVTESDLESVLRLAVRDAQWRGAWLFVARAESWIPSARLLALVLRDGGARVALGSTQRIPSAFCGIAHPIDVPMPDMTRRERLWRDALASRGLTARQEHVATVARRFLFTPAQIASAATSAHHRGDGDLAAAARVQCGEALRAVARKIEPRASWHDLVLPDDAVEQLRELCARVDHRARVFDDWGFARKMSRGRGTAALFSGPSGTGKTMAAEVIANGLGLDLYRIDLARVVSKYIGETEKNLERVFAAAEGSNAILFFDEADALFGKRSEVKDAHDRYANIETSYLLQKLEDCDGIAILATNLVDNLDEAFTRRLAFHIYFPFPDEHARLHLWQQAWPQETPVAPSVDKVLLARNLKVAGGDIKNIALAAAFSAASNGGEINFTQVRHAALRELQKSGRAIPGVSA
jgi:AAA+ superfamily predicted ATPase